MQIPHDDVADHDSVSVAIGGIDQVAAEDWSSLSPGSEETKVAAMTRIFHEALAAGRTPDHRELAKAVGADPSHARRVHQRLITQQSG